MKIIQIIPYFYPAWAYGGTPRVVFDLCRELVKQGHHVAVYTTDTLDKNSRIQNSESTFPLSRSHFETIVDGIRIRYFRNVSNHLAFNQKLFLTPTFTSLMKDDLRNTDIVHLQEYRTLQNVSAWKACRTRKIPYVLSAHGAILRIMGREKRKGLFDMCFGLRIIRDARKLIALTELERRQYLEFGVEDKKVEVVSGGVDASQFHTLPAKGTFRNKYGLEDHPIVLFLGRIHRIKGIDVLIDAFAEVRHEESGCKLIIAGPDDGFKKECGMRIADCGMKQIDLSKGKKADREDVKKADVIFTGMVSGDEKLSLFVDADVTVLPSLFENFPSVPFESLMCGTPIVISSACGIAEMINSARAGYVSVVEDRTDLREKILQVLKNHEEARASVEEGRRLIIERLNWMRVASQMLKVYEDCLQ